jgi:transcriptional regulator with XRE-family HTH domain
MSDVDALLSKFIEEWNTGRRPSVEDYLDQAPEGPARDDLADQISTFLTYAPTPRYDEAAMAQLLDGPAVQAAAAAFETEGSAWRALLPRLRKRAGLSQSELAAEVLDAAGLGDEGRDKAARHLDAMERGELDATSLSDRLLAVLGRVLRMNYADLVRTGMPGAGLAPAGAVFRREAGEGEGEDLEARLDLAADALATPPPGAEWDEVDELFFRGR